MKSWMLILLAASLWIIGCTLSVSKTSITEAKLRRVDKIIKSCALRIDLENRNMKCVLAYLESKIPPIDVGAILRDAYGSDIILNYSAGCLEKRPALPYSIGPNRIDECGEGDDIVL